MQDWVDQGASGVIGMLVDLVDRLVRRVTDRLKGLAPVAIALGASCEHPEVPSPRPAPAAIATTPTVAREVVREPRPLGDFNITFFYVVSEEEHPVRAQPANEEVSPEPADLATLYSTDGRGSCAPIADVTPAFARQLAIQGTGKLSDGRVVNIWGACSCKRSPCFKVSSTTWGTGGSGRQLRPFRSVAVDPRVIPLGSKLYVPLLDGKRMPGRPPWGGFVHDGCVSADDVGGGIKGTQLDLFVGRRGWFLGITKHEGAHEWARQVPVFDGAKRCAKKPAAKKPAAKPHRRAS